jgi:hypothetical protein
MTMMVIANSRYGNARKTSVDCDGGGEDSDPQRHPGSVHHARVQVAAEEVDPEPVLQAGTLAADGRIDLGRVVEGDQRGEDGGQHGHANNAQSDQGAAVAPEAAPNVAACRRRKLGMDGRPGTYTRGGLLVGGGGGHQAVASLPYRIRGSKNE